MMLRLSIIGAVYSLVSIFAHAQVRFYTYTGINGFWDYQTNYRTPQYIRACPGSQMHACASKAKSHASGSRSRTPAK